MRRLLIGPAALALVLTVLLAAPARADVRHSPVKVRRAGEPVDAKAGETTLQVFEILTADPEAKVHDLSVEGADWSPRLLDGAGAVTLAPGRPATVRIEVTPTGGTGPLVLRGIANGEPFERTIDLSPAATALARAPRAVRDVPAAGALPLPRVTSLRRPGVPPATARAAWQEPGRAADDTAAPAGGGNRAASVRTIRVHGRFVYTRSDGVTMGADGVWVRVFDEDTAPNADDELGSSITDAFGYYDFDVTWDDSCLLCEGDPDLYLQFEANNDAVQVHDGSVDETIYRWVTGTTSNFTGADFDKGTTTPSDESEHPALHILTDESRNWRWYLNQEGYDQPLVTVRWPANEAKCPGAWYDDGFNEIHICSDRKWREDTHAHEYGHHFLTIRSATRPSDYCNNVCDTDFANGDCGHCMWCAETDHDAWNEGWPNWIANVQTTSYAADYGVASMNTRDQELVQTCSGALNTPERTEGFIGAFLQDVWDDANEHDPSADGTLSDRLSWGTNEIFDVVVSDQPTDPRAFITALRDHNPAYKNAIWETAKNCTYEMDTAPPGPITGFVSTSHTVNVASPDPTIALAWTAPDDDWSGIVRYRLTVLSDPGGAMVMETDIDPVTAYTLPALLPGRYTVTLQGFDHPQHYSPLATAGPYVIREPEPANLEPMAFLGWAAPAVPRGAADANLFVVPAPGTLPGNAPSTYWNHRGVNDGESATSAPFAVRLFLDGQAKLTQNFPAAAAGGAFFGLNLGPAQVTGGRHTFASTVDALDAIAETVESDNTYGRQWTWEPLAVPPSTEVTRGAPPDRTGGWDQVTDGAAFYDVDGLRFHGGGALAWHALSIQNVDADEDYDCRIHFATASADSGFGVNHGHSSRGAGRVDAVIANANTAGEADWDVGVVNASGGTGDYLARHVSGTAFAFGASAEITLPADRMLVLREVVVPAAGPVSFTARIASGTGPVHLAWFDPAFATGGLLDAGADAVTADTSALARIDVESAAPGSHAFALYRDPRDGTAPVTVTVEVGITPPDATPFSLSAWYSPLVPRPDMAGTPTAVLAPDTLVGNAAATYLNFGVLDDSPTSLGGLTGQLEVDGAPAWGVAYGAIPGHAATLFNGDIARTVRGGRHTLSVYYDLAGAIVEKDEGNNAFGAQWVWSPQPLVLGTAVQRAAPPDRTGGWDRVDGGDLWFNCDGLRTPVFSPAGETGWWSAVAVMPGAASDVDVRLHEQGAGVREGFQANLGVSGWDVGASDFCLVSFRSTSPRGFDAGVVLREGTEPYVAEAVRSTSGGSAPTGTLGPFTLGPGHILGLHEFWLPAGTWDVDLIAGAGAVDWGLSVYDSTAFHTKSGDAVSAWLENGPGLGEHVMLTVAQAGHHCVAVWKAGAADLPLTGTYSLSVGTSTAGVADAIAGRTAFGSAFPNPTRDGASLTFSLAEPGETALEIFDVRGARVCTLVRGTWPAGRHTVHWAGVDDQGASVAPGLYLVRFRARGVDERRKLVRVE